jgi:NAD+ kinase
MVMPIDLILVRHGESEGNLAHSRARYHNDTSAFENEHFTKKHSSQWRLTDLGREQAVKAGEWIREHIGPIDFFLTSEYVRAMETSALLNLPNAYKLDLFNNIVNGRHLYLLENEIGDEWMHYHT